jgi:hypothetical protein
MTVFVASGAICCGGPAQASGASPSSGPARGPFGFLVRTNYHGWENSILVSNGRVEAVLVPAIGRVMQLRLAGEKEGPFWENPALFGKPPQPESAEWLNFGGDKTWPSPQADWRNTTPRPWPPPVAFDAMPYEAHVDGWRVTLISRVDPDYGIRVRREIELDIERPIMTIATTFEKVSGRPKEVGLWVITQLKDPVGVYAVLPSVTRYREGYNRQTEEPPANLLVGKGLLSLTRDPKAAHKIGTDASTLVWLGRKELLRIDSARLFASRYPDQESSAEIYTNPDPLAYVELEMLGPLHRLIVGDKITRLSTYTLLRRTEPDPDLELQRLLVE